MVLSKVCGAMTRDGIRVRVRNLNYRFRILPEMKDGKPVQRTLETPYPYSEEAMQNMTYNLSVTPAGLDPWPAAVRRMVVGRITDYIATNNLDFLTAPREIRRRTPAAVYARPFSAAACGRAWPRLAPSCCGSISVISKSRGPM